MNKRYPLIAVILVAYLLLTSCGGGSTTITCDDQTIVDTIEGRIRNNKPLSSQMKTINVSSKDGAVIVFGWVNDDASWDALDTIMKEPVDCMKGSADVNVYKHQPLMGDPRRPSSGGSCVPGTRPCGEICLPDGQKCNIE